MNDLLGCSDPSCTKTIKNNRWSKTKSGWFFARDDLRRWCPEHIPDWVTSWREGKKTSA